MIIIDQAFLPAKKRKARLEMPFGRWRSMMAKRLRVPISTINGRLYNVGYAKKMPMPKLRRVNKRVVFVILGRKKGAK